MTMPKWHEAMRPVLVALSSGELLGSAALLGAVASHFSMTEKERAERLSSGQLRIYNRMYWAITDLEKAGLLAYGDKRGTYHITDAGRDFLARHSEPFAARDLYNECPSFKAWKDGYTKKETTSSACLQGADSEADDSASSPQESLESAAGELRAALADELLQAVMLQSPYFFEHLVGRLLIAMGYGETSDSAATVTSRSGDEGIDGIVKEDRLGFDSVYYQAKRWDLDKTVGRPEIQAFVGALSGRGADRGLFITTARFSKQARDYAESLRSHKIVLVDGSTLAGLMIDCSVGVSTVETYEVKALDSDFFSDSQW